MALIEWHPQHGGHLGDGPDQSWTLVTSDTCGAAVDGTCVPAPRPRRTQPQIQRSAAALQSEMVAQWQLNWPIVQDYVNANVHFLRLGLSTAVLAYLVRAVFLKPRVPAISVPLPSQAQPGWHSTVLEEPSVFGNDPSLIQCYCPATGQLIGTVNLATPGTVDAAIRAAKAAQLKWRNTTFEQRAQVLRTLLKFILEHQEDIARVSCRDSGVLRHFDTDLTFRKL